MKQFLRKRGLVYSYTIAKEMAFFVKDYNTIKPCYIHQIHTPDEVHANPILADVKPVLENANKERQEANRASCCKLV